MTKLELNKIIKDKNITHCYIKKNSYYMPKYCGYTDYKVKASIYTKEEALQHYTACNELRLIQININEHNKMIVDEIKDLMSRLILK